MKYEVIATMGVVRPEGKCLTLYFQDMQLGALITKGTMNCFLKRREGARVVFITQGIPSILSLQETELIS